MTDLALVDAGSGAGSQDTPEERTVALEFLQDIYNDPKQSTSTRMRAAIECLPFENPKVSAVAISHMDGQDFASALDRAIERSGIKPIPPPKVIEHHAPPELPAEELKGRMPHYRNNFRRF
jgi:hypothetical protein